MMISTARSRRSRRLVVRVRVLVESPGFYVVCLFRFVASFARLFCLRIELRLLVLLVIIIFIKRLIYFSENALH